MFPTTDKVTKKFLVLGYGAFLILGAYFIITSDLVSGLMLGAFLGGVLVLLPELLMAKYALSARSVQRVSAVSFAIVLAFLGLLAMSNILIASDATTLGIPFNESSPISDSEKLLAYVALILYMVSLVGIFAHIALLTKNQRR